MSSKHLQYDGTFVVICENKDKRDYPIRPRDIGTGKADSFVGTFGKYEVEQSARKFVLFFQSYGYWTKFRLSELQAFYRHMGWDFSSAFFGLCGAWYDDALFGTFCEPADVFIVLDSLGYHYVTDRFILRCADVKDAKDFVRATT